MWDCNSNATIIVKVTFDVVHNTNLLVWFQGCARPPCFQGKLVKYFSRQLSCKCKVALEERSAELQDFPRLGHWFRIVNMRKEVTQVRPQHLPGYQRVSRELLYRVCVRVCFAADESGRRDPGRSAGHE